MSYKVESGVPIPMPKPKAKARKYPLREMLIGDSFFVPASTLKSPSSAYASLGSHARQAGIKVSIRRLTEDGVDGFRVWRVE